MDNKKKKPDKSLASEDWKALFDYSPCGFLMTHPDGMIAAVNTTLLSWLGFESGELKEKLRFQDLLNIGGKLFYETQHVTLLKIQDTVNELNYDLRCKDGQLKPVLINTAIKKDESGKIIFFHHAVFPFSDRKKYEKELLNAKKNAEVASKAKSLFLSTITHEIRTPLNVILGATDFLFQEQPRPDQIELLQSLHISALNLKELINDILEYNKIEAGRVSLEERPFNLRSLLVNLINSFRPLVLKSGIELRLIIPDELSEFVIGDPVKINQVLTNLIGNSIKFTKKGFVEIKISAKADLLSKQHLEFTIKDSGIGISEDALLKIFDPFTQANNTIHQQFGGTGLGLSVSQKLLNVYGSKLKVESKIGQGTTFSFSLRLKTSTAPSMSESSQVNSFELEKMPDIRALIVDDNRSNLMIASKYFKQWGLRFEQATNGQEALNLVQKNNYDLVLMDLNMPEMDGYETTRKIRALPDPKYQELPIIAFSATDFGKLNTRMKNAGLNALVLKPYNPTYLHEVIRLYGRNHSNNISQNSTTQQDDPVYSNSLIGKEPDITEVCVLFDNEEDAVKNYLLAVKTDLQSIIADFETIDEAISVEELRSLGHKLKTTIRIFKLNHLQTLFDKGKNLFMKGDMAQINPLFKEIKTHIFELNTWIDNKIQQGNCCKQ